MESLCMPCCQAFYTCCWQTLCDMMQLWILPGPGFRFACDFPRGVIFLERCNFLSSSALYCRLICIQSRNSRVVDHIDMQARPLSKFVGAAQIIFVTNLLSSDVHVIFTLATKTIIVAQPLRAESACLPFWLTSRKAYNHFWCIKQVDVIWC